MRKNLEDLLSTKNYNEWTEDKKADVKQEVLDYFMNESQDEISENDDYWWSNKQSGGKEEMTNPPNKECFAEWYGYNMIQNADALNNVKIYLPDSYEYMENMIGAMK